jgi:hypothetical protein
MSANPAVLAGANRQPSPRTGRVFTRDELDAIAVELRPVYRTLPVLAAATGLRPEERQALERQDIDRRAGILTVRHSVCSGEIVELGKTERSLSAKCRCPCAHSTHATASRHGTTRR